ncbi:MAG: hypothetical protein AAGK04_13705 [Planctomycetota bacterium]
MVVLDMEKAKIKGSFQVGSFKEMIPITSVSWSFASPMRQNSGSSGSTPAAGGSQPSASRAGSPSQSATRPAARNTSAASEGGTPWESTTRVSKELDVSSPDLMIRSMMPDQSPIEHLIFYFIQMEHHSEFSESDNAWNYLDIVLGDCYIIEWELTADADGRPSESFTIGFSKFAMRGWGRDHEGNENQQYPERGWDRKAKATWSQPPY